VLASEDQQVEREAATGCGEIGDDGGEAHGLAGLPEGGRSSFKEAP
jgi:hypothetical protein